METTKKLTWKQAQAEANRAEAIEKLRELAPQGCTIYGTVKHVSRSGMSRRITFFVIHDNSPFCIDYWIEKLGLYKRSKTEQGLVVGGCGMDMVFSVVYNSSSAVWRDVVTEDAGYVWKYGYI